MGVAIQSDEAPYQRFTGGYFPSCVGKAVDCWAFGGSAEASRKGLVNGVVGSFIGDVFEDAYVSLQGNTRYFNTNHTQAPGAFGYAIIGTVPVNTSLCGNYFTAGGTATYDVIGRVDNGTTDVINIGVKGQNRISITGDYDDLHMVGGVWDGESSAIAYLSQGNSLKAGTVGIYEGDNAPVSTVKVAGRSGGGAQDAALFWLFEGTPTGPEMQELWEWSQAFVLSRDDTLVFG